MVAFNSSGKELKRNDVDRVKDNRGREGYINICLLVLTLPETV